MQIGAGLPVQSPLLQIFAGGLSLAVVDPALDVYIGTHPPASLERTAFVRFSHPNPVGARLHQQRGVWFVNSDPGPVTLVDGEGRRQSVPRRNDGPVDWEKAAPIPFCLLAPGLSRLIFSGSEEACLWVPGKNPNVLSAGDLIDVVSEHQRALNRARVEGEFRAKCERNWEAMMARQASSPAEPAETEEEASLRREIERAARERSDLDRCFTAEPPGPTRDLLAKAVRMAERRQGLLEGELATLKGHTHNMHHGIEDALDKLQNKPPLLTADQYAWALAYARSRVKGG